MNKAQLQTELDITAEQLRESREVIHSLDRRRQEDLNTIGRIMAIRTRKGDGRFSVGPSAEFKDVLLVDIVHNIGKMQQKIDTYEMQEAKQEVSCNDGPDSFLDNIMGVTGGSS